MAISEAANDLVEARKKRILFRAWHRGTKEMDLLLGRFADSCIAGFNEADLNAFERLMELPDPDLYNWIVGAAKTPAEFETPILQKIRDFHLGGSASA